MAVDKRKGVAAGAAFLLFIILASSAGMALSKRYPSQLATAAERTISEKDFLSRYGEFLLKFGLPDNAERRRQFLDNLIDYHLAIQAAYDEGIEKTEAYRFRKETVEQKLLVDLYVEKTLFDTLDVTENDLREMFVRINTSLKARHLYARTRERADSLYARLQQGERFEDLAREVFADSALANSGGSLGYFGFDETDPAFEEAAYNLEVGAISKPVRTATGYSIIQVEDRKVNPVLTEAEYESKKGGMRWLILDRKRQEARSRFAQELAQELNLEFDEAALNRLLAQIQGELLVPETEIGDAATLVTFVADGEPVTWNVDDFRTRARYTSEEQRAGVTDVESLKNMISGLAVREVMLRRARELDLNESPAFDELETKAEADRVKTLLSDYSFSELARRYSIRPGADASGGNLGFVSREQLGSLAESVFSASEGEVLGPLEIAGRYALLAVGERQASRPARFEEVSAEIASSMKPRLARETFYAYLKQLRDRYDVTMDELALMSLDVGLK